MTSITTWQQQQKPKDQQQIKSQDNITTTTTTTTTPSTTATSSSSPSSFHFDPTTLTQSLPLLPFQNQVGGNCSFFQFSKRAICKPMSHKERQFYEHLEQHHVPLLPFTSQYLGVVNVTYPSSNVQAMLPEVILADNEHLLANWKRVCSSTQHKNKQQYHRKHQSQQKQKRNKKNKIHRRSISNDNSNNKYYMKGIRGEEEEEDNNDDDPISTWSPTTFKEQVLREVFSPHALEERLRQVQDWQKGMRQNQLNDDHGLKTNKDSALLHDSQKIRLQSRSVLDFRHSMDTSISSSTPPTTTTTTTELSSAPSSSNNNNNNNNNNSLRLISSSYPTDETKYSILNNSNENINFNDNENNDYIYFEKENNNNNNDSPEVTVHPRRPTIIETTTSAPQTPRMRETRLHNPIIRPPTLPSSTSPILQTSSPLPGSPTSTISSSSISILPSPLPSQQRHSQELNEEIENENDQVKELEEEVEEEEEELMIISKQQNSMDNEKKKTIDNNNNNDNNNNSSSISSKEKKESASWRPRRAPTNPWSEQMYRRDLEKVNIDDVQQFILIEDLTDDIKYPCVLDLKMGTRQHGVYATEAKMKSQTEKCKKSTSLKLGVRISGMQIYNFHQGQFIFEDKYKGRELTTITFRDTLIRYFDNGHGCQVDFLPTLIRKLVLIFRIIESMDAYRFYASSLLIIYDANTSFNQMKNKNVNVTTTTIDNNSLSSPSSTTTIKNKIDVRLIDFAKSISKHEWITQKHHFTYPPIDITSHHQQQKCKKSKDCKDEVEEEIEEDNNYGPDPGYLLGVQTLIKCFLWIYTNHGGKKETLSDLNEAVSSIQSSPFWSKNDIDAL
ncbi:unnamed protein product [Cunninghamella echinulata]